MAGDFDPVEIRLDLVQNVDSEGAKATKEIVDMAAASTKMRAEFEANMIAQQKAAAALVAEIARLKQELAKPAVTNDQALIAEKQKLIDQIENLNKKLLEQEAIIAKISISPSTNKMKDDVTSVTGEVQKETKVMTDAFGDFANQSAKEMKQSIAIQKTVIKDLQQSIKELQSTASNSTGQKKTDATAALGFAKKDLIAEQAALLQMQRLQTAGNEKEAASQIPILGGLGKWVIGLASVGAAMKIGKDIIESTEGSAHQLEMAINAAEAATGYFFKTIASGDWSNFWSNMDRAIKGAIDYTNAIEVLENKKNEQKIKSSSWDIKIGEARERTYSTDPAEVKAGLQDLVKFQTEKLTEEAKLARYSYEIKRKKAADDNGWNEMELQRTIQFYSDNQKIIEEGEKYSLLKEGGYFPGEDGNTEYFLKGTKKHLDALENLKKEAAIAGRSIEESERIATSFMKVPLPVRADLAESLSASNKAFAAIDINNRRDKQRLVNIKTQEDKDAETAQKAAQTAANKKAKEQNDYESEIGRQRIASQLEIDQTLLNAQKDGAEKQRQQAELDYRKTLIDLANRKADQLKKMNIASGGIDEKNGNKTATYNPDLPTEDQAQIDQQIVASEALKNAKITEINDKAAEEITAIWQKVTDYRLKGIEKEKAASDAYFDKMQKAALKAGDLSLYAEIEKMRGAANDNIYAKYDLEQIDYSEQLETQKNEIAANGLNRRAKLERANFDTWVKYQKERIKILKDSPDEKERQKATLMEGDIDVETAKRKVELQQQLIGGAIQLTNQMIEQLGLTEEQTTTMKGMVDIAANLASGNYVGAAVSAFSTVISLFGESNRAQKKALEEGSHLAEIQADYMVKMIDLQLRYNLALNDQVRLQEGQSIFITDYVELINNASDALIKSQNEYNRIINDFQVLESSTEVIDEFGSAWAIAYRNALNLQEVVSNLLTPIKKVGDNQYLFGPLLSDYPELISASGEFNSELAKTLLSIEGLPDATKTVLEGLIEWSDQIKENQEAINSAIESIAGSISTNLYSALSDVWDAGTDSFLAFKDSVSKGIKDIVRQMLFNAVFSDQFKTLQTDMTASFGIGGDGTVVDDVAKLLTAAPGLIAGWKAGMNGLDAQLTAAGFDIASDATRTGSAKGIAQASQDSVDEWNGRMTAVQQYIYDIRSINQQSFDYTKETKLYEASVLSWLETIAENTDYCRLLVDVKQILSDISLKGVKLKS